METFVSKFGGTSVASAAQLRKVQAIIASDARRRIIVPSAPGKRQKQEPKVTDLLYLCHEMATLGTGFDSQFQTLRERFTEIETELDLKTNITADLDELYERLNTGVTVDYVASRGECFNGKLLAALLDAEFIDPTQFVTIRSNGSVDPSTYKRLGAAMADPERRYVMPGFYGSDAQGRVKTFSRGGSDISGAIAARAAGAALYENWTDVSGMLMADPRVVESPKPMLEVTYREIRELSYMGASVFHDEAILPVREVGIPICIKNTNEPEAPGTRIVTQLSPEVDKSTEIAGVAGKRGFSMICLEKSLMNKEVGFLYRLLGIFERYDISVEHCPSSIDGLNVIVDTQQLGDRADTIMEEIQRTLQPDRMEIIAELALIAVVGEGMSHNVGIAAKTFQALHNAGVNVSVINQGASELNIIIGVAPDEYEKAVRALYAGFVS